MSLTNCSSGSNVPQALIAGGLVVTLTGHAVAPIHDLGHFLLPPQEHIELSSTSSANVGIYPAPFAIASSGSTLPSTGQAIRY